jgi:predicted dehydrogenase
MLLSRRSFLRRTAAASAVLGFPAFLRSASPNGMLQVAVVGCNGQGLSDLSDLGSHKKVKFVGFCDIDTSRIAAADKKFPGVPQFQDYREMFAKLGDGFDAVQVSTPDHWHALISLDAMRKGKHVYCQKPLTHTVWEARQMRLGADKAKVITQMGNQIHSAGQYRTAVKWIRDGAIGKIKAVHSWIGNRGNQFTGLSERPKAPAATPPATLNWDLWVGPAPLRDFQPKIYAPFNWRDWMDFGGGGLGDFGCHVLDTVFSSLDLTSPLTIHADVDEPHLETWCKASTISYLFPGTPFTAEKTVPVTWYDGGRRPDAALALLPEGGTLPGGGTLYIGEGGTLVIPHVDSPKLYPVEKFKDFAGEKVKGASHYHVWADAVLANTRTSDGFHYAGPLTETVNLGLIATRFPAKKLEWDAAGMKFPNAPEAEQYLTRTYREGYVAKPV